MALGLPRLKGAGKQRESAAIAQAGKSVGDGMVPAADAARVDKHLYGAVDEEDWRETVAEAGEAGTLSIRCVSAGVSPVTPGGHWKQKLAEKFYLGPSIS